MSGFFLTSQLLFGSNRHRRSSSVSILISGPQFAVPDDVFDPVCKALPARLGLAVRAIFLFVFLIVRPFP